MTVVVATEETIYQYTSPCCHIDFLLDVKTNRVYCPKCGVLHTVRHHNNKKGKK